MNAFTWIPVNESLPDADVTVLIVTDDPDNPVWPGFYDGEQWRLADGFPQIVTHWAPMPEPPGSR